MGKRIPPSAPWTTERGAIRKDPGGRIRVVLVYPNTYAVGMTNLGFQTVYARLNALDHVVCERAFAPEPDATGPVRTIESGVPIDQADLIALSISFEQDYPRLLSVLTQAGLPLRAEQRGIPYPLVAAGGIACFLNPEPIAPFIDFFILGEAEANLTAVMERFDPARERTELLRALAVEVPGVYVPFGYRPIYGEDQTLTEFISEPGFPTAIAVPRPDRIDTFDTETIITTDQAAFDSDRLLEVSRGCPHGCRFCSAGFIYRPPRFRSGPQLAASLTRAPEGTAKVGLVGAAVSDLPALPEICVAADGENLALGFSSLRADALTPDLIATLTRSRIKTATIAPETASKRLRDVINKNIDGTTILNAVAALVSGGIPNLKLYYMVGLPTETAADIEAIVTQCRDIQAAFVAASRPRKRIGTITVSLNSFVPKPATPFQWAAMDPVRTLRDKIRTVRQGLKTTANITVQADNPKHAHIQALLSRGDRRVAELLITHHENGGNWPAALKSAPVGSDFFVCRERPLSERLPWEFLDTGVRQDFLAKEYQRAQAARPSPACPMRDCQACGACGSASEADQR